MLNSADHGLGKDEIDVTISAYMLCTSPRSGSTLLCRMLHDTGVAGRPLSYFFEEGPKEWAERHGGGPVGAPASEADLDAVFGAIRAKGCDGGDMFGVRQQAHSNGALFAALRVRNPDVKGDAARLEAVFGPMRYVYLNREDKVAQAVSYVTAAQSGLWHRRADGTELERLSAPAEPVYDRAAIEAAVEEFTGYAAAWEAWFEREAIVPLRLSYDEVAGDPRGALGRVLGFVGGDRGAAAGVAPSVAKLADARSAQWIARYRAGG